eukprot:RCo055193
MTALAPVVAASYVVSNTGTVFLFFYDKQQAVQRKWRVPERTLHCTALAGGWIGGWIAMQKFHHKSRKAEFVLPYALATAVNIVGTATLALFLKRRGINLNTKLSDVGRLLRLS